MAHSQDGYTDDQKVHAIQRLFAQQEISPADLQYFIGVISGAFCRSERDKDRFAKLEKQAVRYWEERYGGDDC